MHVVPILRMDGAQEGLVRERRALGDPKDPPVLVGPEQLVALDVQAPAPHVGHGLGVAQVFLALAQGRRALLDVRFQHLVGPAELLRRPLAFLSLRSGGG